jgi:hypothetical protein
VAVTYLTDESGNRLTTETTGLYLILSRSGNAMTVNVSAAGARRVLDTDGRVVQRLAARVGETTTATVVLYTDSDIVDLSGASSVSWLATNAAGTTITGTADGNATTCDLVLAIATGTTAGKYALWVQADDETWPTTTSAEQITLDVLPDR